MPDQLHVHFATTGPAADRRLIREYILDAVERLPRRPACDGIGFVPVGHKPGGSGLVILEVFGDAEAVVDHERDRWDELVDEGVAEEWRRVTDLPDPAEYYGEHGAELRARLAMLAAQLSRHVFEEFDQPPDAVDEHPDEASERAARTGTGWWTLLHYLTHHQAMSYEEEVDALAEAARHALLRLTEYRGAKPVDRKIDGVIETFEATRDQVEEVADGRGDSPGD